MDTGSILSIARYEALTGLAQEDRKCDESSGLGDAGVHPAEQRQL
jgi:hypothetical protein